MGKFGKVFGIIILLIVVVIAGLMVFVRYYLTEERVKALVIPQAETALGREVTIGKINIGLFSGITIHDFLIKESDPTSDFVSAKAFVLSYELLPLLQKKLIISQIRLDEPAVQITRDKNGKFNFSSLAILAETEKPDKTEKTKPASAALPLALTINAIELNNAKIKIRDQMAEIPAVDATSSIKLNLSLGRTLRDLQFNGTFDFEAAVAYDTIQTQLTGNGIVTQKDFEISLDTGLDDEQFHTEADIKNYMHTPNVAIALSSESLNIDKLLAIIGGLPKTQADSSQEKTAAKSESGKVIADSLPPGLTGHGTVRVTKAVYQGLTANDFNMAFDLSKGILTVSKLSARAYDGEFSSSLRVDLNQPDLAYDGKFDLQSVQAGDFSSALMQNLKGMLTGSLQSNATFSGTGTSWQQLSKVLSADGSYTLTDGGIKGTPVTRSISNLLGLQELNNISYKNISGIFTIVKGGKVKIKTNLAGTDLDAEAEGIVGLDGSLDLPLTFHLSPALADKLKARASFTKYLSDEQGATTLHLKLAGSLKSPRPTLDMKGVQEQLQKSLEKEIIKQLDSSGKESDQKTSPENIIKGLFGK
jgi:uncharacterized protein involved in outer membrane biogenesis